jgi:hypothetical protein
VARSDRLVIRIKEVAEGRVDPVIGVEPGQNEGFEEPGRVRQVPLCRADVVHRLDGLILGRKVGRQRLGLAPYGREPLGRGMAISAASHLLLGIVKHGVPLFGCSALVNTPSVDPLR